MAVKTGISSTADHVVTVNVADDPGPGAPIPNQKVTVVISWNPRSLAPVPGPPLGTPSPNVPPPGLSHTGSMTWTNYPIPAGAAGVNFSMKFACVVPNAVHIVNAAVTNHSVANDEHNNLVGVAC